MQSFQALVESILDLSGSSSEEKCKHLLSGRDGKCPRDSQVPLGHQGPVVKFSPGLHSIRGQHIDEGHNCAIESC